jgi:hypothetical protein
VQVSLSWSLVDPALAGVTLVYQASVTPAGQVAALVAAAASPFVLGGLSPFTAYSVSVGAAVGAVAANNHCPSVGGRRPAHALGRLL